MPDSEQLGLVVPAHHNQHLFSDHYLNRILPDRAQWNALTGKAQSVMEEIAELFAQFVPSDNEAQTEDNLVKPVLKALGHTFEIQASLKTADGTKKPDYVFYSDADALNANKKKTLTDALPNQGGIAVGDAKFWMRPLDIAVKQSATDLLSNKNPSYQISFYMQHSGVTWGILTNGKHWRLYHKDTAHKLDHFYEVDLQELVESADVNRFLYFYALFRRDAFDDGPLSIAALLRESADYARNVGDSLKDQVYDSLRHIAQGFLDYPGNKLQPEPDTLATIYQNSLILLYRLIFILYAEARELLPVRENQQYRETYSLHAIKQSVALDVKTGKRLLAGSALLWPKLQYLFKAINDGDPPLSVSTFNGGLFDPKKHEFLTKHTVGDAHLQKAIDKLARVRDEFVDYRDLAVQHMGTIYEGLLEYRLQPIVEPEADWAIELVNDKGERKASGSYYTPDYIVKYIVENTLGPVLKRAVEKKKDDAAKILAVLSVNVLDPAMGSGHFLVEATEFIARFLVDIAVVPQDKTPEEADLAFWKRRVVQACVYGVDLNPLAVELAKLSLWLITVAEDRPLSFLDHHLRPGNSLVGARLENLTVAGATKKRKVKKEEGQISLFTDSDFTQTMKTAVANMWMIEENDASNVRQVKKQEKLYETLREQLTRRYSRVMNLVTAAEFGLELDRKRWPLLFKYATSRDPFPMPAMERVMDEADTIAKRERFFHWELEFPEIYFDQFGRPLGDDAGFEAVVGNPPYVRQEKLAPYKPYFEKNFPDVYHGVADIFVYFFVQGLQQSRQGGLLSYISSNSWLRANYATPLRHYLRTQTTVEQIVDLGDNRVFEEAPDVYPAIHVVRKETPPEDHTTLAAVFSRGEGVSAFARRVDEKLIPVSIHDQNDAGWQLEDVGARSLLKKLMKDSKPLGELVSGRMYRGVLTGLNEAFIIDSATRDKLITENPRSAEILKPVLRGEDLRSWCQEDERQWLVFTRRGIDIEAYPTVKAYLEQFHEQLEPKPDGWDDSRKWPGRKSGTYKWYEIQDSIDYYAAFDQTKIMWPDIAKYPRFSWDDTGYYLGNTGYIAVTDKPWLLGFLSSRCAWYIISNISIALGERAGMNRYRLIDQYMRSLPVRVPTEDKQEAMGDLAMSITALAKERYGLHCAVRHRLESDLGMPGKKLNQKLTAWWEQDFGGLRAEIKKVFKTDIPVNERDQWEAWFADQCAEHVRLTDEIIQLETELNERVYALFHLTPDEIKLIEESTKYKYGEV